ncbi:MAG: hypothetical protein HGA71_04065 [Azonexaceae bacterium]|nr:hypothetical protein [Azonexaceae bacterium]
MRSLLIAAAVALSLTACATQSTPPVAAPAPTAMAPAPKAPECYNGDSGKFEAIASVATISGVKVVCEKTSDGKNAQWMGIKK